MRDHDNPTRPVIWNIKRHREPGGKAYLITIQFNDRVLNLDLLSVEGHGADLRGVQRRYSGSAGERGRERGREKRVRARSTRSGIGARRGSSRRRRGKRRRGRKRRERRRNRRAGGGEVTGELAERRRDRSTGIDSPTQTGSGPSRSSSSHHCGFNWQRELARQTTVVRIGSGDERGRVSCGPARSMERTRLYPRDWQRSSFGETEHAP